MEKFPQSSKVFLYINTYSLRGEGITRKVSVVGVIVEINGEIAIGDKEIFYVEISDEWRCVGCHIISVTEFAVYNQTVV